MGCVSKSGPQEYSSKKIKELLYHKSGPEDQWLFLGQFILNNICKQPFIWAAIQQHFCRFGRFFGLIFGRIFGRSFGRLFESY